MFIDPDVGHVTNAQAQWAACLRYDELPPETTEYAKRSILDGIGCSLRGLMMDAGQHIIEFVGANSSAVNEATIWGRGHKTSARLAGLVNGTTAHIPNVGDSHNVHPVHMNYLMPQAAIALAERIGGGGREVITACVAGTELVARAALATNLSKEGGYFHPEGRGWQATGAIGGIGTSAAAARILGLNENQMLQAIVMGGTQLTGIYRPSGSYMGKALFAGKAVAAGIENAAIAKTGFIAGYRLYEDGLCFGTGILSPVYELEAASAQLGKRWECLNVDFCIHPAKKTFNATIDALLDILRNQNIEFDDIEEIKVLSAYSRAHAHQSFVAPTNSTEAFNCLHYIIAVAARDGDYCFRQLEADRYSDAKVISFAKNKVIVIPDLELEKRAGKSWPGGVTVVTKDGQQFTRKIMAHKGEIHNPLDQKDLEEKFRRLAGCYEPKKVESIISVVRRLEEITNINELTSLL